MAARLVAGAGTRRHSAVSSQVTGTTGTAAGVAELADAPGLGPGPRKGVEVRVLSPAPDASLTLDSCNERSRPARRATVCMRRGWGSAVIDGVPRACIRGLERRVYTS